MKRLILIFGLFIGLLSVNAQVMITGTIASSRSTSGGLGPELVTNGGFDTDTDWDKYNGTTISGGEAIINLPGTYKTVLIQTISIQNQHTYRITFDVTNYSSGNFEVGLGNTSNGVYSGLINANGSYSFDLYLDDASAPLQIDFFAQDVDPVLNIDNVSVKEIL